MSKMIQIRNVPEALHRKLKARAANEGMSLSEFLLREIERSAAYPTPEEMAYRLSRRTPVKAAESIVDAVRAERDSR